MALHGRVSLMVCRRFLSQLHRLVSLLAVACSAAMLAGGCAPLDQALTALAGREGPDLPEVRLSSSDAQQELRELAALIRNPSLKKSGYYPLQRMLAARRMGGLLIGDGKAREAAHLYMSLADEHDEYEPWYLFAAAAAFEADGSAPAALLLHERLVATLPDMQVGDVSLHKASLEKLLGSDAPPEKKVLWYREYLARFPESEQAGVYHFLLAKCLEDLGRWDEAIDEYRRFLPYFAADVPGWPDAHQQARAIVEFSESAKDWTYERLDDLVAAVRKAIASGSASSLRKLMAKAGFFAMSWYKEGTDEANSRVLFNFSNFMNLRPIKVAASLDPSSGDREAFLRTEGWTGFIPVWYFYFRKVHFPADPRVHGHWEWAGIYFGEKLQ